MSRELVIKALSEMAGVGVEGNEHQAAQWIADVLPRVNTWLGRGDGVAVYQNADLSHPDLGEYRITSFGQSQDAVLVCDEPPQQLPDTTTQINWRFTLVGTYKGNKIEMEN